jgi:hypothetical protein
MRVAELIAQLSQLDPSWDVLLHAEHGECAYRYFDIESVETVSVRRSRDAEGKPHVELGDENGRPQVLLTLTPDF